MSAKVLKKLVKKAVKNAAKDAYKSAGKEAAKEDYRVARSASPFGLIPSAMAAPAIEYNTPYDTSGVPGGNAEQKLMARLEEGPPALISAPRSDALQAMTMQMRGAQRALEGSPASLLFPDSLTSYLETVNRRTEDPNTKTRLFGLLDLL